MEYSGSQSEKVNNLAKCDKKNYIIGKSYECFVKNGIENTTTRDICAKAKINANTLYYYFKSKNDILIECVNYGFVKLEDALFDALKEFETSSFDIFPRLTKIVLDYAPQMRFLHQAVSSPSYEEYRVEQFKKVNALYDRFGKELAKRFECPLELIKDNVSDIMTLVSYYSLWGIREMAAIQFNRIFNDFKNTVTNYIKIRDISK